MVNAASDLLPRRSRALTRLADLTAAHYRRLLALLIIYQVILYGWVVRAYLHVTGVLFPWLLTQPGYRLYENVNISYAPVYIWFNAIFMQLIPDHSWRLRIGTIVIAAFITLLVFVQARRWWNIQTGLLAALLFATWGTIMLGYMMYFEFILGLLSLSAVFIWHDHPGIWWRAFGAGLLVGAAVLIKQPALAIVAPLLIWRLVRRDWQNAVRDNLAFGLGILIPGVFTAGILASQGVLERGLFLMTTYNRPRISAGIHWPDLQDIMLLTLWLSLVPIFLFYAWKEGRQSWIRGLLLFGLMIVLFIPAFPYYGRFHLSGALPFAAIMSAGAVYALFKERRNQWVRIYGTGVLLVILVVGAALPFYYRLKLGPLRSQYEVLKPIVEWSQQETGAPPATRIWILPDIDPTGNFYPISGYLPPSFYTNTYRLWFANWPDIAERMIAGLEADPPQYVIVVNQWRSDIPEALWRYVAEHYSSDVVSSEFEEMGTVTLYRRNL